MNYQEGFNMCLDQVNKCAAGKVNCSTLRNCRVLRRCLWVYDRACKEPNYHRSDIRWSDIMTELVTLEGEK